MLKGRIAYLSSSISDSDELNCHNPPFIPISDLLVAYLGFRIVIAPPVCLVGLGIRFRFRQPCIPVPSRSPQYLQRDPLVFTWGLRSSSNWGSISSNLITWLTHVSKTRHRCTNDLFVVSFSDLLNWSDTCYFLFQGFADLQRDLSLCKQSCSLLVTIEVRLGKC